MTRRTCDVAVIGAGTAGLAAERAARRKGAKTLLIDPYFAGTTCANVGCMPSKLLIAAAATAHSARRGAVMGVKADPVIDGARVMERLREQRDAFVQGVLDAIARLPDEVRVTARARFTGTTTLALDNGDEVEAKATVIATGASPMVPDPFKPLGDLVLTNETIFDLDTLPESLGVIGGGPLGLELAQAMARLGVRVALFDRGDDIAGLPRETSDVLLTILRDEMDIEMGASPEAEEADGQVEIRWGDGKSARFEKLLVATGRPPQLDGLDLQETGLSLDDHGMPVIDGHTLQCGRAPIFVAGDVSGSRPVLHEASDEGAIAGSNAASWPEMLPSERKVPMAVTFTDPASAVIGMLPPEGADLLTGRVNYADQGRAKVEARAGGLVRLHARPDGRLVGADLCAPGGDHLAHLIAWAVEQKMAVGHLLDLPFYHPTLEEGLQTALRDICKQIGLGRPQERDDGPRPGA